MVRNILPTADGHETVALGRHESHEELGHPTASVFARLPDNFFLENLSLAQPARALATHRAPFHWKGLPEDVKRQVFQVSDDVAANRLALTNRENFSIAIATPRLHLSQVRLLSAIHHKKDEALLAALTDHQAAFRLRNTAITLPGSTSQAFLVKIADLLEGAPQRPLLLISRSQHLVMIPAPEAFEIRIENLSERHGRLQSQAMSLVGDERIDMMLAAQNTNLALLARDWHWIPSHRDKP